MACGICDTFYKFIGSYNPVDPMKITICEGLCSAPAAVPYTLELIHKNEMFDLAQAAYLAGFITLTDRNKFVSLGTYTIGPVAINNLGSFVNSGFWTPSVGLDATYLARVQYVAINYLRLQNFTNVTLIQEQLCDCFDAAGERAWLVSTACFTYTNGVLTPCP